MIYNDRQYNVSQAQVAKLKTTLDAAASDKIGRDAWLRKIEVDALRSQISEIEADIAEYELLKSGEVTFSETCALSELPRVLVQARVAKGLSQTDLAERLNMKPQQVQRYEATNYMSASLARLIEVATVLDVKISESFEGTKSQTSGAIFSWADANDVSWSRLPLKEMIKRKWFTLEAGKNTIDAAREFFLSAAGPQFASALHRKKVRSGSIPNEYSLLAWQARTLALARKMNEAGHLKPFELDDTWIPNLVQLTRLSDGPARARRMLAERGIALVVERHLSGTYLDGAAMLSDFGNPIIALTLRYDRLDNFWFVLFHELAHVFLHLFDNLRFDFFDEEDGSETDGIEKQADQFALDALIPPSAWDRCLSRFAMTDEAVRIDAESLGIDESIIAGRIRKERNNYMILTSLVGQDTVRSQLEGAEP
jgi:HTH-type transcriptional regulator / antitoxin HigA